MVTGIEICFDYLPTWVLKKILRNDFMNMDNPVLSDEAIVHICEILVERSKQKEHFTWQYLKNAQTSTACAFSVMVIGSHPCR